MKLSFASTISLAILLVLIGSAYVYLSRADETLVSGGETGTTTALYECNADGRICPDGTVVGRTGPTCQFSSCPGVVPVGGRITHSMAILHGQVSLSPTCPVMRNPPEPGCEPKRYVTDVTAYTPDGEPAGASTKTTSSGLFVLDLNPGTYVIRATGGPVYPRCEDVTVTLEANASSSIAISCDSGIR